MTNSKCWRCRGDLPDPHGVLCPHCGRRLRPLLTPRDWAAAAAIIVAVALLVSVLVAQRRGYDSGRREGDDLVRCALAGQDYKTCHQPNP